MRIIETYDRLTLKAEKRLPCPLCGKKIRRQTTFGQTLNPFNRNADGSLKTRREIYRELSERAATWQEQSERCTACRKGGDQDAD